MPKCRGCKAPALLPELDSDLPPELATEKVSLDGVHGVRAKPPNYKNDENNMINTKCPRYIKSDVVVTLYKNKRPMNLNARVAQLVEQWFCKPQVVGSIPISSSRQDNI